MAKYRSDQRDRIGARRGLVTPGDIIPEWRDHLGMVGDIKSERWARSFRNRGRHRAESANSHESHNVTRRILRVLQLARPDLVCRDGIIFGREGLHACDKTAHNGRSSSMGRAALGTMCSHRVVSSSKISAPVQAFNAKEC